MPLDKPQSKPSSARQRHARAPPHLGPWGSVHPSPGAPMEDSKQQDGAEVVEPAGALRAQTTLPFKTQTKTLPLPFLPPLGTDVQLFCLWQCTQQRFCFHLCQEGSKVHKSATSPSNQFPCLPIFSIKMFLLILTLIFLVYPIHHKEQMFLVSAIGFYAFEDLSISPFSCLFCFPVFPRLIGPPLL